MAALSTLAELAKHCKRSEKSMRADVRRLKIPHIRLGRRMLFDLGKVQLYLESISRNEDEIKMRHGNIRPFARPVTKYAARLGL